MTQLELFPGYQVVYFCHGDGWKEFFCADLKGVRRVGANFKCPSSCPYDSTAHFMITGDGNSYTKLCTLDVLKLKPFKFDKELLRS